MEQKNVLLFNVNRPCVAPVVFGMAGVCGKKFATAGLRTS